MCLISIQNRTNLKLNLCLFLCVCVKFWRLDDINYGVKLKLPRAETKYLGSRWTAKMFDMFNKNKNKLIIMNLEFGWNISVHECKWFAQNFTVQSKIESHSRFECSVLENSEIILFFFNFSSLEDQLWNRFLIRNSSTNFLIYHATNDWEFDIKAFYRWTNMSLKCTLKRTTFINYPLFSEKQVHKRASMMIDYAECEWDEKWQTAKPSLSFSYE